MTKSAVGDYLNESRCLSGGSAGGFGLSSGAPVTVFGLSSGAGLSRCTDFSAVPSASAQTMRLVERMVSRGGVLLHGGRRYAAAAALTAAIGLTMDATANALDVYNRNVSNTHVTSNSNNPMSVHGSQAAATSPRIESGGTQFLYDRGWARWAIIRNGGSQIIYDRGYTVSTNLSSGGVQSVSSGGTAMDTHIHSGGSLIVNSSGSATTTFLSNGGTLYVSSGGVATQVFQGNNRGNVNVTVYGGDNETVISGRNSIGTFSLQNGSASNFFLYNGGRQDVSSGGVANITTISSGGVQSVHSSGSATGTRINNGGEQYVINHGSAIGARINRGGLQIVISQGSASGTIINGGKQSIDYSGSAVDTIISNGGYQEVGRNGKASNTSVGSGGTQSAVLGGSAISTIIYNGGLQSVYKDGYASDTIISNGGRQYVNVQGKAYDTIISNGGTQNVSQGMVYRTTISDGGLQNVYSSGYASKTTISSGGSQNVYNGGSASNTSIGSGGTQNVYNYGLAFSTYISDGGSQNVHNRAQVIDTHISSGGQQSVFNRGMAFSTHISSGGKQFVYNNGSAESVYISSGGQQLVYDNGFAIRTSIYSGGSQNVSATGVAINTIISSGGSMILSGGSVSGSARFHNANDLHGPSGVILSGGSLVFDNGSGANVSTALTGAGRIVLSAGSMTLGNGANAFSGDNSLAGGVLSAGADGALGRGGYTIAAAASLYAGDTDQTMSYLSGAGATILASGGRLTLNQTANTVYSGQISGSSGGGTLVKNSSGTITLANPANSLGSLVVNGGGVMVGANGSVTTASGAKVQGGGWFGGAGTMIGDMSFGPGGVYAPAGVGASVGAYVSGDYVSQTISGDLTLGAGAVYQVRTELGGNTTDTDFASATGAATFASGAIVQHVASGGLNTDVADPDKKWTILTASSVIGGVDDIVTKSNLLFLGPVLSLDGAGTSILMSFDRVFFFDDFGETPNQSAVGDGLASLDPTGPLASTVVGITDDTDVGTLYNQLSGEMHASLTGGLMLLDRDFSRWILDRSGRKSLAGTILSATVPSFESAGDCASILPDALESRFANNFWADVGYARHGVDGDHDAGRYTLKGPELTFGYDHVAPSGWLGGVAFRYGDREMKVGSRLSEADIDSFSVAAYGGFQTAFGPGAARLVLGGAFTRHNVDAKRGINAGLINQRLTADYHANSYQLFMEGAYAIPAGRVWLEPFIDLAWTSLRVPGFVEKGGNAMLRAHSQSRNSLSQLLGVRLVLPTLRRIDLEAQAGWRHTYGNLDKAGAFSFAEGSNRFGIKGGKLNRDEVVLDLRAVYQASDNLRLGLEANAAVGERGTALRGGTFIALEW